MLTGPGERAAPSGVALPAAVPYPWPFDGAVNTPRLGLLVVAAQRGVAARCARADATTARIDAVAAAATRAGVTIVRTRHATPAAQRRPHTLPSPGHPEYGLLPGGADIVLDAPGFDAFFGTPLGEVLTARGITHLVVCGLWLEGPVHSTLRGANDRGFECALLADACAPTDPALERGAISSIEMSGGIFGAVASSADFLGGIGA